MSFNSLAYAVLLTAGFAASWTLKRFPAWQTAALLLASYEFYARWRAPYVVLILGSSLLDYIAGKQIHRSERDSQRKRWLLVSLCGNLGLLAWFKYANFFYRGARKALHPLGLFLPRWQSNLALPVGISFFTFQSMSYTIDIYRGLLTPAADPLTFLLFVAFFPQLVAGPIVRASQFLPQLQQGPRMQAGASGLACLLIAIGLLKKCVIADLLAVNLVDRVFESPIRYTAAEVLLGVYGYAFQIYCDFSAYTDIAIGSALLLGYRLPRNFDRPYAATDLRDFWRRWHISLSTWLRDYLYIPLGGNRGSSWQTFRNLMITMVLGGLWHGAAMTFLFWGLLHGLGLWLARIKGETKRPWLAIPVTFHLVCLGWVFFRAPSFADALALLRQLTGGGTGTANITPLLWLLLALGAMTQLVPTRLYRVTQSYAERAPALLQAALLLGAVMLVAYAGTTEIVPFIYFQF